MISCLMGFSTGSMAMAELVSKMKGSTRVALASLLSFVICIAIPVGGYER